MSNHKTFVDNPLVRGFVRAFSIDYRTLALFRVYAGCIIIGDILSRCRDFTAFFTDQGIIPRPLAINWFWDDTYSLYFINGGFTFNAFMVVLTVVIALMLILGYKTRFAAVASWVLLVSLHQRTGILSHGGDDLIRVLMFWGMFLPLGARFSLDAAMEKNNPYPNETCFSVGTFALLMQVMYVYWVGALLKTGDAWMHDYTAVYFALSAEDYSDTLGIWVRDNLAILLPVLTYFVYKIELYGPLFLVAPFYLLYFRLPILFLLICMHLGFLIFLNVGPFPFISICSLLLFLPKEVWNFIAERWVNRRSQNITVFYDENCDFCLKVVMILKTMLILPHLVVKPAQQDRLAGPLLKKHDSWVILKPNGEVVLEWSALVWLVGCSPLLAWLKWPLALFNKLFNGKKAYHWIGDRRIFFGHFTKRFLPWRTSNPKLHWITSCIIAGFFALVLHNNLTTIPTIYVPPLTPLETSLQQSLGLWQTWDMFAPYPVIWTQWPIIEGITQDGRKVDLFRQKSEPPSHAKPKHILKDYTHHMWRKFYSRLYLIKFNYYRPDYVAYECRRWNNDDRPYEDRIVRVDLYMGNEKTLPDPSQEVAEIESMGSYNCP